MTTLLSSHRRGEDLRLSREGGRKEESKVKKSKKERKKETKKDRNKTEREREPAGLSNTYCFPTLCYFFLSLPLSFKPQKKHQRWAAPQ